MAVLDGHETHASYRRHCSGCLERYVALLLLANKFRLLLDLEAQRSGENEVAAALRLLERVMQTYPRAIKVVLADALYAEAPFVNFLLSHRKHVLIVLKDEQGDLYRDAMDLFGLPPLNAGATGR